MANCIDRDELAKRIERLTVLQQIMPEGSVICEECDCIYAESSDRLRHGHCWCDYESNRFYDERV